jgi:hypothetical protein
LSDIAAGWKTSVAAFSCTHGKESIFNTAAKENTPHFLTTADKQNMHPPFFFFFAIL